MGRVDVVGRRRLGGVDAEDVDVEVVAAGLGAQGLDDAGEDGLVAGIFEAVVTGKGDASTTLCQARAPFDGAPQSGFRTCQNLLK